MCCLITCQYMKEIQGSFISMSSFFTGSLLQIHRQCLVFQAKRYFHLSSLHKILSITNVLFFKKIFFFASLLQVVSLLQTWPNLKDDSYLLILLFIALTLNIKLHICHVASTVAYSIYGCVVYICKQSRVLYSKKHSTCQINKYFQSSNVFNIYEQ